jgi:hypothetical protein
VTSIVFIAEIHACRESIQTVLETGIS